MMIQLSPTLTQFFKVLLIQVSILLFIQTYSYAQQEITEEDKAQQMQVLKENPKNFDAHYLIGAYYYNKAVEPHVETTQMGLEEYLKKGDVLEKEKQKYLRQALPYFENAYVINSKSLQVRQILKTIYQQLGDVPSAKASEREMEEALDKRLKTLEFKTVSTSK